MTREDFEEWDRLYSGSPDTIGNWGEILTAQALRSDLNMRVVRTLYIGRSQIDMIAISNFGVFVVENKNYHGVVSGNVKDRYWDVQYVPGGKVYKLYNPVLQNRQHSIDVRSMLSLLGHSDIPVYSPVIFNDMAELHIEGSGGSSHVYTLSRFVDVYHGVDIASPLDDDTCRLLYNLFCEYQDSSDEAKLAHISSIRSCVYAGY